jgi:hypothetical protein
MKSVNRKQKTLKFINFCHFRYKFSKPKMISVSTIKGLLLANKYDECFKNMGQHFEGPDSSDIVAAGKVLGLVS